MYHSTEVSQDCHLCNLDYDAVDQLHKDCSLWDAISFFFPLSECRARTAIPCWLLLMLRLKWFVQAWQNSAGSVWKVIREFFPGCSCSVEIEEETCPDFLVKFPYLCLCVLIKNSVNAAHAGLQGAGAQPSSGDACWDSDMNAGLKVNCYQMFILATLLIKCNYQSPGVIDPSCSEPIFKE